MLENCGGHAKAVSREELTTFDVLLVTARPRDVSVRTLLRQLEQLSYGTHVIGSVSIAYTRGVPHPRAIFLDLAWEDGRAPGTVLSSIRGIWEYTPILLFAEERLANRLYFDPMIHDFLILPLTLPELEARLRFTNMKLRGARAQSDVLDIAGLRLNQSSREVTVDHRPIALTFKEFELLKFLIANPRHVHSRTDLLRAVWETEDYGETRTVDMHIRRLRAKLGDRHGNMIHTVRSVGYRFG